MPLSLRYVLIRQSNAALLAIIGGKDCRGAAYCERTFAREDNWTCIILTENKFSVSTQQNNGRHNKDQSVRTQSGTF